MLGSQGGISRISQVPWQPLSWAILFVMSYAILFVESHPIPNQEAPVSIFGKVGNQRPLSSGLTPPLAIGIFFVLRL